MKFHLRALQHETQFCCMIRLWVTSIWTFSHPAILFLDFRFLQLLALRIFSTEGTKNNNNSSSSSSSSSSSNSNNNNYNNNNNKSFVQSDCLDL